MKIFVVTACLLLPHLAFAVTAAPKISETFTFQETAEVTVINVKAVGPSQLGVFFNKVSDGKPTFILEVPSQDFTIDCIRLGTRGLYCSFVYTHSANSTYKMGDKTSRIILPLASTPDLKVAAPTELLLTDKYGNNFILKINTESVEVGLNLH